MQGDSWTCLMVGKGMGIVPENVRDLLKATACRMHLADKVERMSIRHSICDGVVETEWNSYMVGARAGILFHAEVHLDEGECPINFLLNIKDLERGAQVLRDLDAGEDGVWYQTFAHFPVPELYRFRDLRHKLN